MKYIEQMLRTKCLEKGLVFCQMSCDEDYVVVRKKNRKTRYRVHLQELIYASQDAAQVIVKP